MEILMMSNLLFEYYYDFSLSSVITIGRKLSSASIFFFIFPALISNNQNNK